MNIKIAVKYMGDSITLAYVLSGCYQSFVTKSFNGCLFVYLWITFHTVTKSFVNF